MSGEVDRAIDGYAAAVQREMNDMAETSARLRAELRLTRITLAALRHSLDTLDTWQQDAVAEMIERIDAVLNTTDGKVL